MHYLYRRRDNSEVLAVDFDTMMTQDALGCITLDDGTQAKRDWQLEALRDNEQRSKTTTAGLPRKIDSITCGFPAHQFQEFQDHCRLHGITGVEPIVKPQDRAPNGQPYFYEVRCDNEAALTRLGKTMGQDNHNGTNSGWSVTPEEIEAARRLVESRHANK